MISESSVSVLLADFQFLTKKGLTSLIAGLPGYRIIAEVKRHQDLTKEIRSIKPDILALDVMEDNVEFLEEVQQICHVSNTQILIMTNTQNPVTIRSLINYGLKAIVTKNCSEAEIISALHAVSLGNRFYCSQILEQVIGETQQVENKGNNPILTPREHEVLTLIARGNTTQKIAEKLHISIHTVNSHRKNILKKLNINSPIQMVTYAMENGLVAG